MSIYDQKKATAQRIFISYSSIDRIRINGLRLLLEAMGHQVFHDHLSIKPGMKWRAALQEGLDDADAMLVFWTRHAARSHWVRKEYEHFSAQHGESLLVPILGDDTPLSELLKTRQHADFAALPNEVLAMKRTLKADGKSNDEIVSEVLKRLREERIEITEKQRKWFFLFLGFNWLAVLFRHPVESAKRAGNAVAEKAWQASPGAWSLLAIAVLLGFAARQAVEPEPREEPPPPAVSEILTDLDDLRARLGELREGQVALSADHGRPLDADSIVANLDRIWARLGELREGQVALSGDHGRVRDGDTRGAGERSLRGDHDTLEAMLRRLEARPLSELADLEVDLGEINHRLAQLDDLCRQEISNLCPGEPQPPAVTLMQPIVETAPQPANPDGEGGRVTLRAIIRRDGSVDREGIEVERSEVSPDLTAEAVEALAQWEFKPGLQNDAPVPWPLKVTIRFAPSGP